MSRIKIERQPNSLDITYNWRTAGAWFIAIWAIFWNTFVFVFLLTGAGWFIGIHALVGILVGYFALTRFTNKSRIRVSSRSLQLTHGPLPWPFSTNRDIPARSLVQLYVDKSGVKVNKKDTYNLVAKLDTGSTVKLLKSEGNRQLLLDLERTIEAYLDIQNDSSYDLSSEGHTTLDLEKMKEQLEKMESIKKWLPKSIVAQMDEARAKVEQQAREMSLDNTETATPAPGPVAARRDDDDWDVSVRLPATGPKPLPAPTHDFSYPLYHAAEGTVFQWNHEPYRVGRTAQIDWEDDRNPFSRQMELHTVPAATTRYLYTEEPRDRWTYYEERRLDDDEVVALGFDSFGHPTRFENGDERYYPRNEQIGIRYVGNIGQPVRQFIYFTTASTTQFRALQPDGRAWEVYVMEPVDDSGFEKG